MDPVYPTLPDLDLDFSGARACFDELLEKVGALDTMQLSHDEVEHLVKTEGRDVPLVPVPSNLLKSRSFS